MWDDPHLPGMGEGFVAGFVMGVCCALTLTGAGLIAVVLVGW